MPKKHDDVPLVLPRNGIVNDAIYMAGDKRIWTGGESTQELIFETKPGSLFSYRRNTMKQNKPSENISTTRMIINTATSLFSRKRQVVKKLFNFKKLDLGVALLRDDDGALNKATTIEFYDPKALTRCHSLKLEDILKEVDEYLKNHKASGNMNLRLIDTKKERDRFSILTLTEEASAADHKAVKLPYLNVILTNGVKLKYLIAPPRQSVIRMISDDDITLVAVDASPIESALGQYLTCSVESD